MLPPVVILPLAAVLRVWRQHCSLFSVPILADSSAARPDRWPRKGRTGPGCNRGDRYCVTSSVLIEAGEKGTNQSRGLRSSSRRLALEVALAVSSRLLDHLLHLVRGALQRPIHDRHRGPPVAFIRHLS